jgi:hypothetical protein
MTKILLLDFLLQIFELEKRFLYQKYLSPADRDEIAAQLGLSNAQVDIQIRLLLGRGCTLAQCAGRCQDEI